MRSSPVAAILTRFASQLRFPTLFAVTAGLFVLDLLIPDMIPFADEILLGMATLLLATWKETRAAGKSDAATEGQRDRA